MQHVIPELDREGLRRFAITTGAIVAVLFGLLFPWLLEFSYPRWPWLVFGFLAAWGIVHPTSIEPVYYAWMRLGLLLSRVTTPIIMGIVFFLVLLPMALIMRYLIRRDPLKRNLDANASTYRVLREQTDSSNLRRPF